MLDLIISQAPAIDVEVALDAGLVDRLGDDTPAFADTPDEQNLLRGLALVLGNLEESWVLVKRRIGRAETGVSSAVNTLGGVVGNELRGGVVRVQFDLVDSRDDLGGGVIEQLLQVLDTKVGDTDVANFACGRELLHLLPGLDEVPVRKVFR